VSAPAAAATGAQPHRPSVTADHAPRNANAGPTSALALWPRLTSENTCSDAPTTSPPSTAAAHGVRAARSPSHTSHALTPGTAIAARLKLSGNGYRAKNGSAIHASTRVAKLLSSGAPSGAQTTRGSSTSRPRRTARSIHQ